MVKLAPREGPYHIGRATPRSEQKYVAGIGLFDELFLAYVVKAPWFLNTLGT